MKIISMPIEVISWTSAAGEQRPLRFKMTDNGHVSVVKIDRIAKVERTQRAGESAVVYTCESHIRGDQRLYELRYTLSSCQWVLYKI